MSRADPEDLYMWVKQQAKLNISTIKTRLTDDKKKIKENIVRILAGKGKPENVLQDAEHVFEASKYGTYFVTTDMRILKRQTDLLQDCNVFIVKPSEMLNIYRDYKNT
ncbi:hypothetical protein BMS3Abin10_00330 [bacterium BMS3Abin10]|nr:hypothetical protein BMS3Abin10_00330 [bacterium BMS3Abin10]GBE40121.1 hypothetical protein BMS3Bbin08_02759 [bacterium BMS3Bbin08]